MTRRCRSIRTHRRPVALLLADLLELIKLGLLVLGEMGRMAQRILERLDAGEVRHGELGVETGRGLIRDEEQRQR